ncbi:MAG: FadR family transcriptional regulator [Gammaproteobacteria bacterium]|nr:FadR family transcriptional regulator [Gammaproteobacteria bacterium]
MKNAIIEEILSGQLKPGQRLPAERLLAAQHGISRAKVREALAQLAALGWIQTKRGDGSRVNNPVADQLQFTLDTPSLSAQASRFSIADVTEFRAQLEPNLAALAAERRSDQQLMQIAYWRKRHSDEWQSVAPQVDSDMALHLAIADASGNAVAMHTLRAIMFAVREPMRIATQRGIKAGQFQQIAAQHSAIETAIRKRSPEAARQAMAEHLGFVLSLLK